MVYTVLTRKSTHLVTLFHSHVMLVLSCVDQSSCHARLVDYGPLCHGLGVFVSIRLYIFYCFTVAEVCISSRYFHCFTVHRVEVSNLEVLAFMLFPLLDLNLQI